MIAWRSLAALALVLGTATLAAAGEPTERLRTFFERANGVILAPESEGSADARVAAVRALVTEVFDVDGAAALALGRRWEALAPPARATFTRLYADVVERAYLAWVGSKARVGEGGVSVRWLEELVDGDAAVVRSVLLTRAGGELPIDYRLVRREGDWLVRDVVVDGVSLAANYRVQFERVLQLGSYDELLARLRDKAGPAARGETIGAMAVPSPMGPLREEIAAPQTSRTATLVVAEIRDRRNAIASDERVGPAGARADRRHRVAARNGGRVARSRAATRGVCRVARSRASTRGVCRVARSRAATICVCRVVPDRPRRRAARAAPVLGAGGRVPHDRRRRAAGASPARPRGHDRHRRRPAGAADARARGPVCGPLGRGLRRPRAARERLRRVHPGVIFEARPGFAAARRALGRGHVGPPCSRA